MTHSRCHPGLGARIRSSHLLSLLMPPRGEEAQVRLEGSRDELRILVAQHDALRRVATLVARGADPGEVFSTVAEEMARCLDVGVAEVFRYESTVPVALDVAIERQVPESAEVAAYYVLAESLTNAAKHAQASEVAVRVDTWEGHLHLVITDNGVGGANSQKGSGLIGLQDRVEALGGRMRVKSPPHHGTSMHVSIPLDVSDERVAASTARRSPATVRRPVSRKS